MRRCVRGQHVCLVAAIIFRCALFVLRTDQFAAVGYQLLERINCRARARVAMTR